MQLHETAMEAAVVVVVVVVMLRWTRGGAVRGGWCGAPPRGGPAGRLAARGGGLTPGWGRGRVGRSNNSKAGRARNYVPQQKEIDGTADAG